MDKMRALNYFQMVAKSKSFSQAAKHFAVSPSSISRRIQDLETELGVALLHRTTRAVRLTELGTLYLEKIQPAIQQLALADEMLSEHSNSPSGHIRITANNGYGRFRLLPALKKLRRQYPELVIDLELSDQVANMMLEDVDFAIRSTSNLPERTVARKLAENRFLLVASPNYLARYGTPRHLTELQEHRTLLYRSPQRILHWQAKTEKGWQEVQTNASMISNIGDMLLEEAVCGAGIALLPDWGLSSAFETGELVELVLDDATVSVSRSPRLGMYLLYHRPKYQLQKIRIVADFLLSELTEKTFQ